MVLAPFVGSDFKQLIQVFAKPNTREHTSFKKENLSTHFVRKKRGKYRNNSKNAVFIDNRELDLE
jgi:hypothetical protein